jgi:hypothetical protein
MWNQPLNGVRRKCTNQPGALAAGRPFRADERGPVGAPQRGADQGPRRRGRLVGRGLETERISVTAPAPDPTILRRGRRTGSPKPPGRPRLGVHEHRFARRPLWYVPHLVEGQLDLPNAGACKVAGSQASGLAGSVILVTTHSSMPFSPAMPPVRRVATGRSGSPRRAGVPGPLTSRWPWPAMARKKLTAGVTQEQFVLGPTDDGDLLRDVRKDVSGRGQGVLRIQYSGAV